MFLAWPKSKPIHFKQISRNGQQHKKNKVSKISTIAKEGHTWNNQSFSENYCFLHINRFQISCEKHKNFVFFVLFPKKHAHVYNSSSSSSSSQKQHERKRIKSQNCWENSLERKETSLRQFQSLNCELIENRHFFLACFNSTQLNNVTRIHITGRADDEWENEFIREVENAMLLQPFTSKTLDISARKIAYSLWLPFYFDTFVKLLFDILASYSLRWCLCLYLYKCLFVYAWKCAEPALFVFVHIIVKLFWIEMLRPMCVWNWWEIVNGNNGIQLN